MAASIPISQIVQVNPGVLSAAGSAVDLNGLFLTQNAYAPYLQFLSFASASDVGTYFGTASTEYAAAVIYFNGPDNSTKKPGNLYFTRYAETAIASFLRSARLSLTLTQLQALSGVLTISVNGVAKTSATINLSAATSFTNAATLIQSGFTSPGFTVTYDPIPDAFIFTNTTTGATSTMTVASGTLSASLKLDAASGAVLSQGSDAATLASTEMNEFIAINQNWACFGTLWESSLAEAEQFADWSNAVKDRYCYISQDTDVNAKTAGSTSTVGYYVKNLNLDGTCMVYGDYTHVAFVMGYAASLDFNRLNGRATIAFKTQSGLVPSVTNASDASALETNGYNFFGSYANAKQGFNFFYPGSASGNWKWLDTYLNQIWLNANLQLSMLNLLMNVNSIPYNTQGYALVEAASLDPINQAVNFGAIRTGVNLSTSQITQIQTAIGMDVSQAIKAKGFYLQIVDAPASVRAARTSPSMTLYYADGGSIQRLTLASIEIQ